MQIAQMVINPKSDAAMLSNVRRPTTKVRMHDLAGNESWHLTGAEAMATVKVRALDRWEHDLAAAGLHDYGPPRQPSPATVLPASTTTQLTGAQADADQELSYCAMKGLQLSIRDR